MILGEDKSKIFVSASLLGSLVAAESTCTRLGPRATIDTHKFQVLLERRRERAAALVLRGEDFRTSGEFSILLLTCHGRKVENRPGHIFITLA